MPCGPLSCIAVPPYVRLGPTPCPPKPAHPRKAKGIDYARGLLRTTGADCEESVKAELTALFQRAGVDPSFSFRDREFVGGRAAFLRAMMRKTAGLGTQASQAAERRAPLTGATPEAMMSEEQINILEKDSEVRRHESSNVCFY